MPIVARRASDLMLMWVGKSEKLIARMFTQAEQDGALLLLDEVDSFLQDRRGAMHSWEVSQVNEMLNSTAHLTRVMGLRTLTPGDFATVVRQNRFGAFNSANDLVSALEAECAVKDGASTAIGFVH